MEYEVVATIWGSWNLQHLGDPKKFTLNKLWRRWRQQAPPKCQ